MLVSMHAAMRDKYQLLNKISVSLLFLASISLNAFVFFDDDIFRMLGLKPNLANFVISISSIIIFFLSIILMVFQWQEKSQKHESAKNDLYELLEEARKLVEAGNVTQSKIEEFELKKVKVLKRHISIPEKQFNRLKHKHYQKKALSRYIDENHHLPYFIVVLKFWKNKV